MKHVTSIAATALFLALASCNAGSENTDQKSEQTSSQVSATNGGAATVVQDYLALKNALFQNDEQKGKEAAKSLTASLKALNTSTLPQDQAKSTSENIADMTEHAEHISDAPIDHQREHFMMLSEGLSELIKVYGAPENLYVQHCPMANKNKGADWISESKEISNPYFGAKDNMAACGSVTEEITAGK